MTKTPKNDLDTQKNKAKENLNIKSSEKKTLEKEQNDKKPESKKILKEKSDQVKNINRANAKNEDSKIKKK